MNFLRKKQTNEKYTPALKSKLERIVENADMIIRLGDATDRLKSAYNSIKEDWKSLEGDIENWKQIQFTSNDFTFDECYYEKFTKDCLTNMRYIEGICKDTLAEINAEKENDSKKDVETNKKQLLSTGTWVEIIFGLLAVAGIIIGAIYNNASQQLDIRYDQGRLEMSNELADTLNAQQNVIQNLLDSLEKIKLRNVELEKCIKLKKNCK